MIQSILQQSKKFQTIVKSTLENYMYNKSPYMFDVIFWARYIDDVFCVYTGSDTSLDSFLKTLNSYHSKIQFTLEVGRKTLNFLDLKINISSSNSSNAASQFFDFDIYRKPTATDMTSITTLSILTIIRTLLSSTWFIELLPFHSDAKISTRKLTPLNILLNVTARRFHCCW